MKRNVNILTWVFELEIAAVEGHVAYVGFCLGRFWWERKEKPPKVGTSIFHSFLVCNFLVLTPHIMDSGQLSSGNVYIANFKSNKSTLIAIELGYPFFRAQLDSHPEKKSRGNESHHPSSFPPTHPSDFQVDLNGWCEEPGKNLNFNF